MTFKQKLVRGVAVLGIVGPAYFGQYHFTGTILNQNIAQAAAVAKYDPNTDPFVADSAIKAIAKKAKAGSGLESAKKLHTLLNIRSPGGLKLSSSGGSSKDDRPPRTVAETLKKGGDCSEFAYVVPTVLNELEIKSGILVLDVGKGILHALPFAEVEGKKYIIDPQLDEFGVGGAQLESGKIVKLTYEDAKKGKTAKFVRELDFSQARALYHMEWGTYLEDSKDLRNALAAFRTALKYDLDFGFVQRKVRSITAKIYNQFKKAAEKAFSAQRWQKAADLFEDALDHHPESLPKENKAAMHGNAGASHFNAGNFEKAAEHYDKAFELTGDEKFKKEAKEAREKVKNKD
jgi:hypothetical protein